MSTDVPFILHLIAYFVIVSCTNRASAQAETDCKPSSGEHFSMIQAHWGSTIFRTRERAYRIYSTRQEQSWNCIVLVGIPVQDDACIELAAPKVAANKNGAVLQLAGNRWPGELSDIDQEKAKILFGEAVRQGDYLTFPLKTSGPTFLVDVTFKNQKMYKYRIRGSNIPAPQWQAASMNSLIPLQLICGAGRFLFSAGVHDFPVVKTSPTLPTASSIPEEELNR